MRTILTIGLVLASLLAMTAQASAYAPAWGSRDLAVQARYLDEAAQRLYQDVRLNSRHPDVTSRARDLARATHDFRRLVNRRASYSQLASAFRRIEQREDSLAWRLFDSRHYDGYGRVPASLRHVRQGMQRVDFALQRYAFDGRDHRYRGSFVYVPRYDHWFGYGTTWGYGHGYGYGTRHGHGPGAPRHDDRRHERRDDRRDDPRHDDRRHERRDDRRDDPRHDDRRHERRDERRDDPPHERRGDGREDRREDRQQDRQPDRQQDRQGDRPPPPPDRRADDGRRGPRDIDVQVNEP